VWLAKLLPTLRQDQISQKIYGVLGGVFNGVLVICSCITKKAGATTVNEILRPESFCVSSGEAYFGSEVQSALHPNSN